MRISRVPYGIPYITEIRRQLQSAVLLARTHTETSRRMATRRQRKGQYQDSNGTYVARQGNDTLVVTDLERKCCMTMQLIEPLHTSQAGVSTSENNLPFCFSGVHDCWETSRDINRHYALSLPMRFGQSLKSVKCITEKQRYTCMLNIVMGLHVPWESLICWSRSFLTLSTSLCAPDHTHKMQHYRACTDLKQAT